MLEAAVDRERAAAQMREILRFQVASFLDTESSFRPIPGQTPIQSRVVQPLQ